MAKPGKANYSDAKAAIEVAKTWRGGRSIQWAEHGGKGMPDHYKCRSPLEVNGVIQEALFIDLYFKRSILTGVPDKLCFSLMFNHARVMGLDENGPTRHRNSVGTGLAHYMQIVDHPHWHIPVPDGTPGYAEPLSRQPIAELWRIFCLRANINDAPVLTLPHQTAQMEPL